MREDLPDLVSYASGRGATVVVGTNATALTDARVATLKDAGVSGVAVSVDSLEAGRHDHFRGGTRALERTIASLERLRAKRLDFVVQTTATPDNAAEIPALVDWAAEQGAVCFNLYFLVPTGRGANLLDLAPDRIEALLEMLVEAESRHRGAMMVRAKCAPHFMRHVHAASPRLPGPELPHPLPLRHRLLPHHPGGEGHPVPLHPHRGRRSPHADLRRDLVGLAGVLVAAGATARRAVRAVRVPSGVRGLSGPGPRRQRGPPGRGPVVHLRAPGRPGARGPALDQLRELLHRRPRLVAGGPASGSTGSRPSSAGW